MTKTNRVEQHAALPIDAQLAISFAAGKVPVSATDEAVVSAGISWGVVSVLGDALILTKHGEALMWAHIAARDEINNAKDAKARVIAGEAAGQYLDKLGVTDVALLDGEKWDKFCATMVNTYVRHRNAA